MKNVSDNSCRENQNTRFTFSNFFLNSCLCVRMWKNIVERGRPQITIWHMRIACRIPRTSNTHSGYVIFIAFPQQQWSHERASILLYTYIACLVSHLRIKEAALVHGGFHPHYSLSHCHWGQNRMCFIIPTISKWPFVGSSLVIDTIRFALFLPCTVHVCNHKWKWRLIYFIGLILVKIYIINSGKNLWSLQSSVLQCIETMEWRINL